MKELTKMYGAVDMSDFGKAKILVVDDEPAVSGLIETILTKDGHDVSD